MTTRRISESTGPTLPDSSDSGSASTSAWVRTWQRREARILLEELAARGRRLDRVGEGELRSSTLIHTYDRFPVELVR